MAKLLAQSRWTAFVVSTISRSGFCPRVASQQCRYCVCKRCVALGRAAVTDTAASDMRALGAWAHLFL